ncbi:MAG: cytochrome c biogenesis protein CcsA [Flavobacteriales bacterium]|jgi:cytochrome c-type biogenesis protein CcsB|uniref:cytochrome c biogenesis protein n=1 Tax=Blattabacterium sp. (Mastotermes darwiniensis) TaxID=39768 RepID=UPI000231DF53|nr:cytochrome c biogenesis protein CcsA [Blattabacterium sp. (Mastotermes darwiniensis)]AER40363.1 Cytochrome c assembly protein [Blattabacterium sp. (Mastotermes darwiniensis) str. MADAR]MDR1804916.1 cytochrome c biogenesis protein CcsA [Flavobacteriales bacterium]
MQTLKNIFFSTKITAFLFLLLALSMATATFLEKKYSTDVAKIWIYESTWFEIVMLLIIINLIGNIWKYKLWNKKKFPLFIFHVSFVFIFIGGIISRYYSFEGMMSLREGETNGQIISRKNYIKLKIHRGNNTMIYNDPYILSSFHNGYKGNFFFKGNLFKIEIINYIPCAEVIVSKDIPKQKIVKIISTNNQKGRTENYLINGSIIKINEVPFSLNKDIPFGIKIFEKEDKLYVKSSFPMKSINMRNRKMTYLSKNTIIPIKIKNLYQIDDSEKKVQWVIPSGIIKGELKYIGSCNNNEANKNNSLDAITAKISFQNQSKIITFLGGKNTTEMSDPIWLNHHKIFIGYGSIFFNLPFFLRLNKFEVENYPGSEFPSFFISHVTVIDKEKKKNYLISMNHVLDYKGYRFFQSGYDKDEKGTHFSVNNDYLGTNLSYLGYFFISLGMFLTLFWKGSRFSHLKKKLKYLSKISIFIILFLNSHFVFSHNLKKLKSVPLEEISDNIHIPKKHGENFGRLLVQDNKGRIKPIHTMALELLRKIHKKSHIGNLDANQWFISIHQDNIFWTKIPFIKVDKKGGYEFLIQTKANKEGYSSMMDLYTIDPKTLKLKFILQEDYENSFSKNPIQRNEYDKAIINLSERIGVLHGIFQGKYLRIFPIPNDINHTWSSWIRPYSNNLNMIGLSMFNNYLKSLLQAQNEKDWIIADNEIQKIRSYQFKYAKSILPSNQKIDIEILSNKLNIFYRLPFFYCFIGIIILTVSFIRIFRKKKYISLIYNILILFLFILFIVESLGLISRWYISGHAPWSNGYESSIFISWCLVGIGLIFHKNPFVSGLTALIASILLIIAAHSDTMDPEITNLVPVLKSHWLIIHVAIITASYGFFLTGSFLGLIVLILYIFYNKKIQIHIDQLTIINEMSLTIGLFLLTIGTFLGSIWANSSWGRYWSWDPKETWAFISIMVYAFVLHMRLVPGIRSVFLFNFSSILAISSIIMTYFGVNYYLSGLHSYARGEPISIPYWIYYSLLFLLIITVLSYYSYYSNKFRDNIPKKINN